MYLFNYNNRVPIYGTKFLESFSGTTLFYGLVDYYTLDGNANTSIAGGNNGILSGATTGATYTGTGKISSGATFSGTSFISVGAVSSYTFFHQTASYSISCWLKFSNYSADNLFTIMGNTAAAGVNKGISFFYENRSSQGSPKYLRLYNTDGDGITGKLVVDSKTANNIITDNNWHHVVVTSSGLTTINYYIDNVRASGIIVGSTSLGTGNASKEMKLGNLTTNAFPFLGILDEIGMWNRPLNDSEVTLLYNAGVGRQYPF